MWYYRGICLARLARTTKNPKAAGSNSNLGPPAHETGRLSTQPWRSVKNIQTNDRQVRRRRWTFGFSRCTKFRCQLNKLRTQEYRRVANWLLKRQKISHISVAGGCTDCEQHTTACQYRTSLEAVTCELGSLMIREKPTNRTPRQVPLAFFLVRGRI